jgi:uncharacterized protein
MKKWAGRAVLAALGVAVTGVAGMFTARGLGNLAELFGLRGAPLEVWYWLLRIFVALLVIGLTLALIFNPHRFYPWLWRKRPFRRKKIIPILPEVPPTPIVDQIEEKPEEKILLRPANRLSRRVFLMQAGFVSTFAVNGFFIEPHTPQINRLKIRLPNLPPAFEGFTIAHLSDIHVDAYSSPDSVAAFVSQVNALKPDITVVTGDFVTKGSHYFEMAAQTLGQLRNGAKMGVYGVTGNHDHWADWRELAKMQPLFEKYGLPLLRDTATELRLNGDSLWLLGVDDSITENDDLRRAMGAMGIYDVPQALRDERPKILLTHDPRFAPKAAIMKLDLMLSGHTHGGQVYVPGVLEATLQEHITYLRGQYRVGNMQLYVNTGHGTVVMPMRFLSRPEIALITLTGKD